MKHLILLVIFANFLFAATPSEVINRQFKDLQERQNFEQQNLDKQIKNQSIDTNPLEIDKDIVEENCINTTKINILDVTVFKEEDEVFASIIEPYLNRCNGIKNLSNLRDKISNKYIDSGYATSRAYFKAEDFSSGEVNIYVLEGKIEDIQSDDVNILNLYPNYKDDVLNLKNLETIVKQAQRLQSQNLDIQLLPASKTGYTVVKIANKSENKPYYGNIGVNNFGVEKSGKAQIYSNFNYENLLGISDILSVNLNTTNKAFDDENNTFGTSLNYSVPFGRFLFDTFYNYSNYKQINQDQFSTDFRSRGRNESFGLNISYNALQTANQSLDLLLNYERSMTRNFLEEVRLDIQSYRNSTIDFGFKHTYSGDSFEYYSRFLNQKAVKGQKNDVSIHDKYYRKYVIDLGFTKYFETENHLKYDLYARGQYSKDILSGNQDLYMGGVYTVRGFQDEGLSGNKGLYMRNELSWRYQVENINIMPYIGLDYGYIEKNENSIGGEIVGATMGTKLYWNNVNLELFFMTPIKEPKIIEDMNSEFFGVNLVYNY
jgi:hemolysin activation/secretion protein